MRQINRLFGFVWRRNADNGPYEYAQAQTVSAQLLEEEMRNQDRDEALRALERGMEAYRSYRSLTPQDISDRLKHALENKDSLPKEELFRLFSLEEGSLAPVHLYFTLAPAQLTALYTRYASRRMATTARCRSLPI